MENTFEYNKILNNCKFNISQVSDISILMKNINVDISNFDAFAFFNSNDSDATKFDVEYYKKHYLNDIENYDPISHYLNIGVKKGFNPNSSFDTTWYLNEYPDVKNANINPFIHYIEFGIYEGRISKLWSWEEFYKELKKLKLTVKGRNNYLFLVNDSNNEILQHFDEHYETLFNPKSFSEDLHFKKKIFSKNNIDYHFFVVPDKSIVCKTLLPFKYKTIKRNVDSIDELIDFEECLDPSHYFKYDSHMNFKGAKLLTFKFLNYLNNDFSLDDYNRLLLNKKDAYTHKKYDLLFPRNWSYSFAEKTIFPKDCSGYLAVPKDWKDLRENIPEEFSKVHERKTEYYRNDNSFSNIRVLIFRDSSFNYLKTYFSFYFKEMLIYWDHGNLNKKLIEWYKPDLILEIRIERFLESLPRAHWIENREELNIDD